MALTQKRLKEVFNYDPKTGLFIRILKTSNSSKMGIATSMTALGYLSIGIDGQKILAHRAAFLYMTGKFPPKDIDHINRIKIDNRWINLRPATRSQNSANSQRKTSLSGFKGVSWFERDKCWRARIQHNGKQIYLGYFNTREQAHKIYIQEAKKLFGQFARTGE